MENFEFKSKAVKIYDFKKIHLKNVAKNFKPDRDELEQDLMLIRKKNSVMSEADKIVNGDYVEIACKSKVERFNKPGGVTVRVGKGLYNKALENQLIGMSLGETGKLEVGSDKVNVRIIKIVRNNIPELTDANVAHWNIPGVKTVQELKDMLVDEQHEDYIREIAGNITRYVAEEANQRSKFEIDNNEFADAIRVGLEMAYDVMQSQGLDLNKASDSEALKVIGMTKGDYIRYVEKQYQNNLKSALIGIELMKQNDYEVTEEDYWKAVDEKMALSAKSREDMEKLYTYSAFVQQQAANYYFLIIKDYVIKYLKGTRK